MNEYKKAFLKSEKVHVKKFAKVCKSEQVRKQIYLSYFCVKYNSQLPFLGGGGVKAFSKVTCFHKHTPC